MTTATSPADALAARLFGALDLFSVHLGAELGLYGTLAQRGPRTADELAGTAGIAPRYAREWLQRQAVAGLLDFEGLDAQRRYSLSAEHAPMLTAPGDEVEHMMTTAKGPTVRPSAPRNDHGGDSSWPSR